MSMSKLNYKVYNGKIIKELLSESRIYMLAVIFGIGIIIGATVISNNNDIIEKVYETIENNILLRTDNGIGKIFLNSFISSSLFIIFSVFSGFSLIGYPFSIWLPLLKGMGTGVITGYLYASYKLAGLGYCLLIVFPGMIVSTFAFILSCNESCNYSKNAYMKAIKGRGQFEKNETKFFLIRQSIFLGVCVISSLIDAVFSSMFSRFFEI